MNVKNARRDAEDPEDAKASRWTRQEKQDLVVALASETRSLTGACKTFLRVSVSSSPHSHPCPDLSTSCLTPSCRYLLIFRSEQHPERRGRGQTVKSVLVHIRTSNDFYKSRQLNFGACVLD
jgi:hypothetical protein